MSTLSSFFLVGPTAVGKSAVSHRIAQENDLDILSADSMAVYRGLDIGTAKPTTAQRSSVTYWGIDIADATQPFTVVSYRKHAICALEKVSASGRTAIVVGGTGLYTKCLTHGLREASAPSPELRASLEAILDKGGATALQDLLKSENPDAYREVADKKNPRRLIRALERTRSRNESSSGNWQIAGRGPQIVGLSMPSDRLRQRITDRVHAMYDAGMIAEVKRLLASGLEGAPTALQAIGYREAIEHIRGDCSLDDAISRTITRTAQLAKKQNTWFRNQANVHWISIDIHDNIDTIVAKTKAAWSQYGATPISE